MQGLDMSAMAGLSALGAMDPTQMAALYGMAASPAAAIPGLGAIDMSAYQQYAAFYQQLYGAQAAAAGLAGFGFPGLTGAEPVIDWAAAFATEVEPPAKRQKGGLTVPEGVGEVRFDNATSARAAQQGLDGQDVHGQKIKVVLDPHSQDGTKVLVSDLAVTCEWHELKEIFGKYGNVLFASTGRPFVKGAGKGKGAVVPPSPALMMAVALNRPVGEVRFSAAHEAQKAVETLHGTDFQGAAINVEADKSSTDGTKILIYDLPDTTHYQALKDYFSTAGTVLYAGIKGGAKGKGKGKGPEYGGPSVVMPPPNQFGITLPSQMGHMGMTFPGQMFEEQEIPSGPPTVCGEIRYENPEHAAQAVAMLDGSLFSGVTIGVAIDGLCKDNSRVIVSKLSEDASWQDLKDHFQTIGPVAYSGIRRPWGDKSKGKGFKGKGFKGEMDFFGGLGAMPMAFGGEIGFLGEIRFDSPLPAQQAVATLDGSNLKGCPIQVQIDPSTPGGSKLLVANLAPNTAWQDLKDHFSSCGPVAYATIHSGPGLPPLGNPEVMMMPMDKGFKGKGKGFKGFGKW